MIDQTEYFKVITYKYFGCLFIIIYKICILLSYLLGMNTFTFKLLINFTRRQH